MGSVRAIAKSIGFAWKGNVLWGVFEGYRFGIVFGQQQPTLMQMVTAVQIPETANRAAVIAALEAMKTEKVIHSFSATDHGFKMSLKPRAFTGYSAQRITHALQGLAEALRQQSAVPACTACGKAHGLSFVQYNEEPLTMCEECQAQMQQEIIQQEDAHTQLPGNYGRGAVGALLGALLGGIIWVAVGQLGYVAAAAGLAIAALAAKGYTMMKGKLDRVGVVLICVICFGVFVLAQFIGMDISLIRDLVAEGYEPDYGKILLATFEIPFYNSELTSIFLGDSALGLLFLVGGSWGTLRAMSRKATQPAGSLVKLEG